MGIVENILSNPLIYVPIGIVLAYALVIAAPSKVALPKHVPWMGKDNTKSFASLRAAVDYLKNGRELLQEGYDKVGQSIVVHKHTADTVQHLKKGQSYLIPDFFTRESVC